MKLHELEFKLKIARDQGAEDNAPVVFGIKSNACDSEGVPITVDDPLSECFLKRPAGYQEIVLR